MLEMSDAAVEEEVRRALDENPALEATSRDSDAPEQFDDTSDEVVQADFSGDDEIPVTHPSARNMSTEWNPREPAAASPDGSLIDLLNSQLALARLPETENIIGEYIIGNIDDNGYLTRDPKVIADDLVMLHGLDVSADDVRRVFDTVRGFDPAGVGAIDLRDCLLLQLRRKPHSPAVDDAIVVVRDFFDLFSKKHYDRLMTSAGMSRERLRNAEDAIRALNPKPGSLVSGDPSDDRLRHVTPDFIVDVSPEGHLTVSLLSNIPELALEKTFAHDSTANIDTTRDSKAASAFIRHQRDEALGFMRIVSMRSRTLFRVMSAIVKLQQQFFRTGNEADIRPMILKDVSALTGDDQSVVSRACQGKYVATPWGIFPLKHFFNEKFSPEAPDTSSRAVISALRELIDEEDKSNPLSDEALTRALAAKGLDIARRTVAKYREQLSIPVARLRRVI